MTRVVLARTKTGAGSSESSRNCRAVLLAVLLHEQPAELLGSRSLRREPFQGREFLRARTEGFAVPDKGPQYTVDKAAGALLAQLAGEQDALIHSGPFGHTVQEEQLIEPHLKGTQYLGVELVHGFAAIGGHNAPQGDLPFQHAIEQRGGKGPIPGGIQGIEPGFCHQIGIGRLAHHL